MFGVVGWYEDQPDYPKWIWAAEPNLDSKLMLPRKHQNSGENWWARQKRFTVWLLIDAMILPQVHLVYPSLSVLLDTQAAHGLSSLHKEAFLPGAHLAVGTDYILSQHTRGNPPPFSP